MRFIVNNISFQNQDGQMVNTSHCYIGTYWWHILVPCLAQFDTINKRTRLSYYFCVQHLARGHTSSALSLHVHVSRLVSIREQIMLLFASDFAATFLRRWQAASVRIVLVKVFPLCVSLSSHLSFIQLAYEVA